MLFSYNSFLPSPWRFENLLIIYLHQLVFWVSPFNYFLKYNPLILFSFQLINWLEKWYTFEYCRVSEDCRNDPILGRIRKWFNLGWIQEWFNFLPVKELKHYETGLSQLLEASCTLFGAVLSHQQTVHDQRLIQKLSLVCRAKNRDEMSLNTSWMQHLCVCICVCKEWGSLAIYIYRLDTTMLWYW